MTNKTLLSTVLITLMVPLGFAGCGSSDSASGPPGSASVKIASGGAVNIAGDGPVSTLVLVDRTAIEKGDRALAMAYKNAGMQMAAPTIARGGALSVRVFGRVSGHAVDIYTTEIQSLADAGPAARDDANQTATLAAALDVAVGLSKPQSRLAARALERVTHSSGSDIGRMVGQSIRGLSSDSAETRNVLVATDGWILQHGEPLLAKVLAGRGPKAAASLILRDANVQSGTRSIAMLRMIGLGSTSGSVDPKSKTIERLREAWSIACERLPVQECEISAQT